MSATQEVINKLIKLYFNQHNNNEPILYEPVFASFHQWVGEIIPYSLIQEPNYFYESANGEMIYLHGFKFTNIRIKPSTFENENEIKFPSDARKNHLNYFATVVADVHQFVEKLNSITGEKIIKMVGDIEKETPIANIPIMIKSKYCSTRIKQDLKGECKYDPGGYFIVNGAEKIVMSMERMVDNKILVFTKKDPSYENGLIYTAQINSRRNDWSDNLQILTIKNRKDGVFTVSTSSQLVDIPLFILMRALGVEADQHIISYLTYNLEDIKMLNLIRQSVANSTDEQGNLIRNKEEATEFLITKLRKNKRISQSDEKLAKIQKQMYLEKILRQDLLPHLGEDITKKIVFLGFIANRLINVMLGRQDVDDRDALQNKRIDAPGILLGQLFRQNWRKMLNEIGKHFKKKYQNDETPINVISQIKPSTIEQGLKTALATGIWGMNKTKKGVAQSLQRLSWVQGISYLRRILSPSMDESTAKVTSIRQVNNNQMHFLCPAETPEGHIIGIVKSFAMMASLSVQNSSQSDVIKTILKQYAEIKHPYDIDPLSMNNWVKIMLNGDWMGICKITASHDIYNMLKIKRRENIIDRCTSIVFDYRTKEIRIYFDGGRLIRPLLIVSTNQLNITPEIINDINKEILLIDRSKSWKRILSKYPNLIEYEDIESLNHLLVAEGEYKLTEVNESMVRKVEYTDTTKINRYGDYRWVKYTHCEFHAWVMLGLIIANIPFSNHNYSNRNIIHFSQAKQSIGIYLSSYKDRMDISQILYHPQIPLVTTEAMNYNNCLDLPYGENAIVAIASYTGYNQEDSIIFNQSAIDRGIFRADTLKKYHSEIMKNPSTSQDDVFIKPDRNKVTGMKQGDYDKLNEKGYAPEETIIDNEDIIIGKISPIQPTGNNNKVYKDNSESFKSNIQGVIDRVHTGVYNAEGYEMYNVRVRMERKPMSGDKFTCYDDSHEILTINGWVNIKDVSLNDSIASLVNNKLIYQYPSQIQNYDYEGDMYLLESEYVSLCVTPNHRMLIKTNLNNDFKIDAAENIIHQQVYYKKAVNDIIIDKYEHFIYNNNNEIVYLKIDNKEFNIKYCLKVLCIWLVHNHILPFLDPILKEYIIKLSQFPTWIWKLSPPLCYFLIENMMLYSNSFKTYSKYLSDDFQRLCLHAGIYTDVKVELADNSNIKYIMSIENNLETSSFFLKKKDEITLGEILSPNETTHSTSEFLPQKATPFDESGSYVIVNKNYNQDQMIYFKGKVYCCTVPQGDGIIVIRRNGKIIFSGNSRHGQKGTIGITYAQKDMPFTESGIIPDLILNPHGYPSRMSLGHFIECMASKVAAETGCFVDGTPFNNYNVTQLPEALKKLGYSPYGTEKMYCGLTGRKMDVEIFIGPVYNIRLKHMVLDKVHGRARGPKQALTRQPLEGRSRDGGLKIGEMEKDAIVAHGMSQFLKERLMETSDISKVYVCDECGMFASKVIDKDYYRCKGCNNSTRISAVVIPHACKLLFQELTAVNILPRIRTERSIHGDES
jgi:DNA-directed RNA polymerase II subunit RPB2